MKIGSIVIHCFEFEKMVEFWGKALFNRPNWNIIEGVFVTIPLNLL